MVEPKHPKASIISLAETRSRSATPAVSAVKSGYLETWHKAYEDKDALIQENLALKRQQRAFEDERNELIPSVPESVLYYTAIGFGLIIAVGWIVSALLWSAA